MPDRPIRVSVAGATGYTGGELLRWLTAHPRVEVVRLTSRRWAGRRVDEAWPALRGLSAQVFVDGGAEELAADAEVVFLAVPHGAAMDLAAKLVEAGVRVVDLSADFRLKDQAAYERWYGVEHRAPGLLPEAVYGLTEVAREALPSARLVANPGCYPTAVALALMSLARDGLLDGVVSVDAKSGASGAGREPKPGTTFVEVAGNVRPYGVGDHRHTPEMEQTLAGVGADSRVFFTPHLVPMPRGILAACHFRTTREVDREAVADLFRATYDAEPFVRFLEDGLPETRATLGSNFCDVAVRLDRGGRVGVALAALDNLGKGAATQAVQNLNAMFGIDEKEGLWRAPTFP